LKTLKEIYEEMKEYRRSLKMSLETEKTLKHQINKFLSFLDDNFDVKIPSKLEKRQLIAYQKYISSLTNSKGISLKAGSINNLISAAKTFLQFMKNSGYINSNLENVLEKVKTPNLLSGSVLTHKQVKKLIRSLDSSTHEGIRDRTIIELLYSTGIRVGELVKLKVSDIDIEYATMKVFGKGSKERIVPIGKTALKYLTSYIKGVRPFINFDKHQAVFLNNHGNPMTRHRVEENIRKISSKQIIKGVRITPHTFRRSCATEMIRGDANMYHVKELLGHAKLDTLKHYTRLTINDLKKTHSKCHPREKEDF